MSRVGACSCSTSVTGNLDRPGGAMFTEPGRRRRRARASSGAGTTTSGAAGCAACRSSAASCRWRRWPTRCSRRATGQVRALLTVSRQPGALDARRRAARRGDRRAGLHGRGRHLPQRDDPARRRRSCRRPTALERDHYDLVFHVLAVRNTARFTPAVFPKPEGARHDWEIFRELALRAAARAAGASQPLQAARWSRRRGCGSHPRGIVDLLLRTGRDTAVGRGAAPASGRRRPRSAASRACPARLATPDQADRPRPAARPRRPGPRLRRGAARAEPTTASWC